MKHPKDSALFHLWVTKQAKAKYYLTSKFRRIKQIVSPPSPSYEAQTFIPSKVDQKLQIRERTTLQIHSTKHQNGQNPSHVARLHRVHVNHFIVVSTSIIVDNRNFFSDGLYRDEEIYR